MAERPTSSGPLPASPLEPSSDPPRRRVGKRRVRVSVVFAPSPGTVDTLEGPVDHQAGDAIVTGAAGERWPISRARFFTRYRPVEGRGAGDDGTYESLPQTGWAVHLDDGDVPLQVETPTGAVLHCRSGDWLVESEPGDVRVVNGDLFSSLYEELD